MINFTLVGYLLARPKLVRTQGGNTYALFQLVAKHFSKYHTFLLKVWDNKGYKEATALYERTDKGTYLTVTGTIIPVEAIVNGRATVLNELKPTQIDFIASASKIGLAVEKAEIVEANVETGFEDFYVNELPDIIGVE